MSFHRNYSFAFRRSDNAGERGGAFVLTAVMVAAILSLVFYCLEVYLLISSRQQIYSYTEIVADATMRNFVLSRNDDAEYGNSSATITRFSSALAKAKTEADSEFNRSYLSAVCSPPTIVGVEWGRWRIEDRTFIPMSSSSPDPDANMLRIRVKGEAKSYILTTIMAASGLTPEVKLRATVIHDEEVMRDEFFPHYVLIETVPSGG